MNFVVDQSNPLDFGWETLQALYIHLENTDGDYLPHYLISWSFLSKSRSIYPRGTQFTLFMSHNASSLPAADGKFQSPSNCIIMLVYDLICIMMMGVGHLMALKRVLGPAKSLW